MYGTMKTLLESYVLCCPLIVLLLAGSILMVKEANGGNTLPVLITLH